MSLLARLGLIAAAVAALVVMSIGSAGAGATVSIDIGDIYFCAPSYQGGVCDTVISVGQTVEWTHVGQIPHTTTECGASCDSPTSSPLWDSGVMSTGQTFQYTFNTPGTYLYYCEVHPSLQRGRIIVQGGGGPPTATGEPSSPTATAGSGGTAPAAPTPTVIVSGPPSTGAAQAGGSSSGLWVLVLGLVAVGAALGSLGTLALRRAR